MLLVGGMLAVCIGAVALGWLAAGVSASSDRQRAADIAALAGARALLDAQSRALAGAAVPGSDGPGLTPAAYRALAARIAHATASRNGAHRVQVRVSPGLLPTRVAVTVSDPVRGPGGALIGGSAVAEAELADPGASIGADGEYRGPLAYRQGKPMRPDVALAFDRMAGSSPAAIARPPSRHGSSLPTRTPSGSRGRGSRYIGWARSSTSAREPHTHGWPQTRSASAL